MQICRVAYGSLHANVRVCSYTEEDVDACMDRIEVIDFLQTLEVAGGIKVGWPHSDPDQTLNRSCC